MQEQWAGGVRSRGHRPEEVGVLYHVGSVWVGSPIPSHNLQFSSTAVKAPSELHKRKGPMGSPWGASLTGHALWIGFIVMSVGPPGRMMLLLVKANSVPWGTPRLSEHRAHTLFSAYIAGKWIVLFHVRNGKYLCPNAKCFFLI